MRSESNISTFLAVTKTKQSFVISRRSWRYSNISLSSSNNMRVPVLDSGKIFACALCGLLEFHTAVWCAFSLLLQLRAGGPSIGRPQKDVSCAVANTTSGARAETQTPWWPERHFTVQWCHCVDRKDMFLSQEWWESSTELHYVYFYSISCLFKICCRFCQIKP